MPAKIPVGAQGSRAERIADAIYAEYEQIAEHILELATATNVNLKRVRELSFIHAPKLEAAMAQASGAEVRRAVLSKFNRAGVDYASVAALVPDLVAVRDAALTFRAYADANMPELKAAPGYQYNIVTAQGGSDEVAVTIPKTAAHAAAITAARAAFE